VLNPFAPIPNDRSQRFSGDQYGTGR
jgi:hypothetical protein